MNDARIGSLFSGYGGLEQGVQQVLGGHTVWHSEIDPGACKILAHRYPDVPNLGDITTVDWSQVEPVDVLTGGFPCQDVSCAGLRKGLRPDTRSGLWTQFAYAIDQLRPELVVIENVRGLLSAGAHSDLEPCPWCVGDGGGVPLRALGAVLGDLADIGYNASWQGLRAADVGAPHGRFRVFVTAWPAGNAPHIDGQRGWGRPLANRRNGAAPRSPDRGADLASLAADAYGDAVREQSVPLAGRCGASVAGHAGADAATDADPGGWGANLADLRAGQPDTHWGPYGDAVRRWERLTRPAPAPTEQDWDTWQRRRDVAIRNRRGGVGVRPVGMRGSVANLWMPPAHRLSPAFVEWMQGLPAGWVTDIPGLSRNEQLKALGNGVVPQQAAQALRMLLPDVARAAA